MASIKNEIIGSWKLLSYIEVPVNGTDSSFPVGKSPKGILIFNPDGYMSVQISSDEYTIFASDDRLVASDEEIRKRLLSYIAFTGRYTVDNETACVIYHIETSLFPNWIGIVQKRKLDFENDILYQKTLEPILSNGELVHAYMTWQRIDKESFSENLKYSHTAIQ
jgi:hypothetical protein